MEAAPAVSLLGRICTLKAAFWSLYLFCLPFLHCVRFREVSAWPDRSVRKLYFRISFWSLRPEHRARGPCPSLAGRVWTLDAMSLPYAPHSFCSKMELFTPYQRAVIIKGHVVYM